MWLLQPTNNTDIFSQTLCSILVAAALLRLIPMIARSVSRHSRYSHTERFNDIQEDLHEVTMRQCDTKDRIVEVQEQMEKNRQEVKKLSEQILERLEQSKKEL